MPFRYLKDPLFLICFVLYFINRWVIKPFFPNPFCRDHLNDVICIPFWVPIMVWTLRRLRLRESDVPPSAHEILIPLLLWSCIFELLLPEAAPFRRLATCDPQDILCYVIGALVAAVWWRTWYRGDARKFSDDPDKPRCRPGA